MNLADAKTKRKSIKAAATRLRSYLNSQQSENATKFELAERKRKLANLCEQYDEVQSRIECLESDDEENSQVTASHIEERARFEEAYFQLMASYDQRLSQFENHYVDHQSPNSSHSQIAQANDTDSNLRLPKIDLPTFSGADEDWYTFQDSFNRLIHMNEKLSASKKFHYLRSSLKGIAAKVIKSFDITEENYPEAWRLLNERFDHKASIIQTHVKAMFEIAPIHKENSVALRNLLDDILNHFRSLKALKRPVDTWDDLMIHLILTKLDSVTAKEWRTSRDDTVVPTLKELTDFLSKRCRALEDHKSSTARVGSDASGGSQKVKTPTSHATTSNQACVHCKNNHFIFQCEAFRKLPAEKRFEIVKNAHLCINCLRSKEHQAKNCSAGSCRKCGKAHNTLLHFDSVKTNVSGSDNKSTNDSSTSASTVSAVSPSPVVTQCTQISNASKVFLATAIVNVYNFNGEPHPCRVLLDSGSQLSFITEKLAKQLHLNSRAVNMSISGVAEGTFESKKMVNVSFRSRINAYVANLDCILLPRITQDLPQEFCPMSDFKFPSNIILADPNFNIPSEIDMLVGAQIFWQLICVGQIKACKAHPTLQKTKLGWVISGTTFGNSNENSAVCHLTSVDNLNKSISRFWEVEHDISSNDTNRYTPEESMCETHFQENVCRDRQGRFIVKLPINDEKLQQLGTSKEVAKRRFFNLERRLLAQPTVHSQYRNFMQEYISLNHMREIKEGSEHGKSYYIPHHAVFKESSTTTKLRVVFDASCKTSSGLSLNDTLLVGPTIQDDLFSILARFRTFQYAITADVTKMYRQVLIDESQRSLQRILWRESPQDDLKTFELLTLTYGTASASFLAIRAMRKLAEDEMNSFSIGSQIVLRDFYVDDLITGASTLQEALKIKKQTSELLSKGGFELAKWSSNHPSLQNAEGPYNKELHLSTDHGNETRALGLVWSCQSDVFKFTSIGHQPPLERPTKRSILARIASIFDPLGLLGPSIIITKIIMQELWRSKIDWDEALSSELHTRWKEYEFKLRKLSNIEIPRKVITVGEVQRLEIHGFSDASQRAYGACIYVRTVHIDGKSETHLLCSKSRVAPLKTLTIPRLELCGALLLAQLTRKILDCLSFAIDSIHFWTDSRIVLCWLRSCSRQWSPFVAHRIAEIQRITSIDSWRHIPSQENPADVLLRGIMPDLLHELKIWWSGPPWLGQNEDEWPSANFSASDTGLPEKRATVLKVEVKTESHHDIFDRFSKLSRLIRVIAFCFKFIKHCKMKGIDRSRSHNENKTIPTLSNEELEQSRLAIVKAVQRDTFGIELQSIKNTKRVNKNSNIIRLNPFIDTNGILRVGGRLLHADVTYDYKHPILLPGKHPFTRLIVIHEHERHLHTGAQATLAAIRQRYWPTSARNIVRSIINKCVICVRNAPKLSTTLMADLPEARVNPSKCVFQNCGVDYAGPFWYKEGQRKNSKTVKCYIALFICMATKAVHIELAADLSTETYLNVFKRFISRRGRPLEMYSDNGLNFVGARHELNDSYKLFNDDAARQKISDFMTSEGIKWNFIPPRSPHMGGLWEAAIKSAKFHLKRILNEASLKYDELFTLLTQVEAVLNSRPLTPLSSDPNDLNVLTPGHFLIGCPITTYPEPNLEMLPVNRLSRWQRVEQLKQHFWRRWVKEYLHNCHIRTKWNVDNTPIKVGQMVTLQEDNLPPLCWALARVEEVHPGHDGLIRVVSVRTSKGIYKRPITKLCVLPIE